jgi:hypothetical protein
MVSAYSVTVSPPLGWGDADFVYVPPVNQFLRSYVFYALPQYAETNLVIVRTKTGSDFYPVELDCHGEIQGWETLGDYEWTRSDLTIGDFEPVGNCTAARREMHSEAPFGLWVYGWGHWLTTPNSAFVSYGFPGGMSIRQINSVLLPPH